jgi:hypothetical protein
VAQDLQQPRVGIDRLFDMLNGASPQGLCARQRFPGHNMNIGLACRLLLAEWIASAFPNGWSKVQFGVDLRRFVCEIPLSATKVSQQV